ncbi:hypothetical protein AB0L13_38900 [Saccharopolyspora shandongensis]|uniref:hypothetical protein n=1 Tax=Saccharopolyspora shandongensis TaxID=418495 RepID=UPI00343588AF
MPDTHIQPTQEAARRRRAGANLIVMIAAGLLVAAVAAGLAVSHRTTTPPAPPNPKQPPTPAEPRATDDGGWDVAAEEALARRPMLRLPVQDAAPQPLAESAGDFITIPRPTDTSGQWIPKVRVPTPEGALAQLAALSEVALAGVDPAVVDRAYRDLALPGAPDPGMSVAHSTAADLRLAARMASSGPVPGLTATYEVTHGLVKGITDQGRFTVVCVLGELVIDYRGTTAKAGLGECQAMRLTDEGWRISPTAPAAAATSAWPGSASAVRAGYRELRDAP